MFGKNRFIDELCILLIQNKEEIFLRNKTDNAGGLFFDEEHLTAPGEEKDEYGNLRDPAAFLAARAKRLLPEKAGYSAESLKKALKHAKTVAAWIILAGAVLLLCFGSLASILPQTGKVSLMGFILFFGWHSFWFLLTLTLFVVNVFSGLIRKNGTENTGRKQPRFLSRLSRQSGLFCTAAGQVIQRFPLKTAALRQFADIYQLFGSKPRFFSALVSSLTNLYWLAGLLLLYVFMWCCLFFQGYEFYLKSTISDPGADGSFIRISVACLSPAVYACTGTVKPSAEDIRKICSDSADQETHRIIGRFLLGLVLVWMILPRFLLCLCAALTTLRFRRDFHPRWQDEYFCRLLERITPHGNTEARRAEPIAPIDTVVAGDAAAAASTGLPEDGSAIWQKMMPELCRAVKIPGTAHHFSETCIIEIGTRIPDDFYKRLGLAAYIRLDWHADTEHLSAQKTDAEWRIIITAAVHTTLLDGQAKALKHMIDLFGDDSGGGLWCLFTCGERLRKGYRSETATIEQHCRYWKTKLQEIGIPEDHFIEVDHEIPAEHAVKQAKEKLTGREIDGLARQFRNAAGLIQDAVRQCGTDANLIDTKKLHQDITDLYRQQNGFFQKTAGHFGRHRELIRRTAEMVDHTAERFGHHAADAMIRFLPGGGHVLRFCCFCLKCYEKTQSGFEGLYDYFCPAAHSAGTVSVLSVSSVVKDSACWALILELQGQPADILTRQLSELLRYFEDRDLTVESVREEVFANIFRKLDDMDPVSAN
ncbi:MAG: DUF2868 domain-containing protein [Planctomycetaceae bacterium]|jgi:hypothetical protein|nr:DUF2868 domain-containing protein [Planctomycetaceae bacterium]